MCQCLHEIGRVGMTHSFLIAHIWVGKFSASGRDWLCTFWTRFILRATCHAGYYVSIVLQLLLAFLSSILAMAQLHYGLMTCTVVVSTAVIAYTIAGFSKNCKSHPCCINSNVIILSQGGIYSLFSETRLINLFISQLTWLTQLRGK